jgi:hypothetical protein
VRDDEETMTAPRITQIGAGGMSSATASRRSSRSSPPDEAACRAPFDELMVLQAAELPC